MSTAGRRGLLGFGIGFVPHLTLLVVMIVLGAQVGGGDGWAYVAYWGLLEVYLAPLGLLVALVLCAWPRMRPVAAGVAAASVTGFGVIALTVVVFNGLAG
ncbi:hypothetical protein [Actinoplanes sp. L3-i22]|uniref:hypothetical protein n=1 Tax=Actinoplanes sp. L3-i22 TaxID=2836373 RepID=UPI001C845234|nr:hypothetical protein [Actinoplanes sp. L3-i22]